MKIEIIYGELANLLGEHGSQQLLARTFGEDRLIRTSYPGLPAFFDQEVDLVYMGPMTENTQRLVLALWRGHQEKFRSAIDKGTVFFFAGNALDLAGRSIRYEEKETVEGLGLYPFDTFCRRYDRQNEVVLADFQSLAVTGFRSQFTKHTGDAGAFPFLTVRHGSGMNPDILTEGIHDRNFFATSLLGPFLILNPSFTKILFKTIGFDGPLPFEEELFRAEALRLEDFAATFIKKKKAPAFIDSYLKREKEILKNVLPQEGDGSPPSKK